MGSFISLKECQPSAIRVFIVVLPLIDVRDACGISVGSAYGQRSQLHSITQSPFESLSLMVWGLCICGVGREL
jgi:hypothetical protein